jgi:hypothetical protein
MGEYESNIDDILKSLNGKLSKIDKSKSMIREIASTLYANITRRIHNEGQDVNDSPIGSYSTKPTLVGASSFINKTAANKVFGSAAKRKQLEWVTYKGRHLAVLEGGYKQIRSLEGKDTSNVNLFRTGQLRRDFGFEAQGKDYVIGFKSEYGSKLKKYQEEHWGKKIWGVTKEDQKIALQIFERYINKTLNAQD